MSRRMLMSPFVGVISFQNLPSRGRVPRVAMVAQGLDKTPGALRLAEPGLEQEGDPADEPLLNRDGPADRHVRRAGR
jgi:hypothetical protein